MIAFLASDAASEVTGQVITVDKGNSLVLTANCNPVCAKSWIDNDEPKTLDELESAQK